MKIHCHLNVYFLTSVGAIAQIFALGNGGGVIGIIARNGLDRRHIAEALLWVATFAWVTTLLLFIITLFSKSSIYAQGQMVYGLFVTVAYTVCAVFFAVFETFPVTFVNKGLLVFLLAIGAIFAYGILTFWAFLEFCSGSPGGNRSEAGESVNTAHLEEAVAEEKRSPETAAEAKGEASEEVPKKETTQATSV